MEPIFIGITGTSGAGKTTLCESLRKAHPEKIGMIQLDDYFKPSELVPDFAGHKNWDDPAALYLDRLKEDLLNLKQGRSIVAMTKNASRNPEYKKTQQRIPSTFEPFPIMLVEGFLVLQDSSIRACLDRSIWLELEFEKGWSRRTHFKDDGYQANVFEPMYAKHVLPTKNYATEVLDVGDLNPDQVSETVFKQINIWFKGIY